MKVIALPDYTKQVKRLLTTVERLAMETGVAADPLSFPVIQATGGFRKARWGRGNRGKSGGVRLIFYFYVKGEALYLESIYAKNEKENLTNEECKQLRKLADQIEQNQT